MALPPYMTASEKVSYYGLRMFVGVVLLFLIAPILAIMPLSFNSETFFSYPMPGFSTKWYIGETGFFTNRALDKRAETFGHRRCRGDDSRYLPWNPGGPWPVTFQHSGPCRDHGGADFADDCSGDHFGDWPVFLLCLHRLEWQLDRHHPGAHGTGHALCGDHRDGNTDEF